MCHDHSAQIFCGSRLLLETLDFDHGVCQGRLCLPPALGPSASAAAMAAAVASGPHLHCCLEAHMSESSNRVSPSWTIAGCGRPTTATRHRFVKSKKNLLHFLGAQNCCERMQTKKIKADQGKNSTRAETKIHASRNQNPCILGSLACFLKN